MPKIIIFGDIDIAPLYIIIDGGKELTVAGKYPRCINVSTGMHSVAATTISKLQRATLTGGGVGDAITFATNTALEGDIVLDSNEVLLISVKQKLSKTEVNNKVVDISEADKFVNMADVLDYGERAPGEKNKWAVFFLCLFFGFLGVHRFYEKKIGTGILYLLTFGLCGIGVIRDLIWILRR